MSRALALRLALAITALLVLTGGLLFLLGAFERLLVLWERSLAVSPLLAGVFGLFLLGFAALSLWLLWWIMRPPRRRPAGQPHSAEQMEQRLARSRDQGMDVSAAEQELRELERRRQSGELHIALYGQVSAGKSSLVKALLPQAQVHSDVLAGTTRQITRYHWQAPGGDQVFISDSPGFNEAAPALAKQAREEALRAQLVVYLCEGDLTRDQWQAITALGEYEKPMIVAINKKDRLQQAELQQIRQRMGERLQGRADIEVVAIQTGGEEQIIRQRADGSEERLRRTRSADVEALLQALERQLLANSERWNKLRDNAVLRLASGKLDAALDAQRFEKAQALVATYTRRAVVGALAAVSPGSDLVIQGALATQFVRGLCDIYDAVPREIEIEKLLRSANKRLRRNSAVVLAIAGNGFKAFPGAGTVTGGLMHAVAYGLLFDTLGRAAIHNLRTRGELQPEAASEVFADMLDDDLLPRARRLARLVLRQEQRPRQ